MIDCPSSSSKSLYATQTVLCVGGGPSPIMPLMCTGGSAWGQTPMILQQLLCLAHKPLATVSHIISRASFSKRCRPVFDAIGLCMQGKLTQGECKATEAAWTACAQEWQQHNAMRRQRVQHNPRVVASTPGCLGCAHSCCCCLLVVPCPYHSCHSVLDVPRNPHQTTSKLDNNPSF